MNIGIIIGRLGGMDGVALETRKWIEVLRSMDHQCYVLAGQFVNRRPDPETETLVPEISAMSPESFWSQKKAFFFPETDPQEVLEHMEAYSTGIAGKILDWIRERQIGLIISENASSLPLHLELGLAIKKVVADTGLPCITHDHHFAWEKGERFISPHKELSSFIGEVFPLRAPSSIHAVINSHAAGVLEERYQRKAVVVPNVMDFTKDFGQSDEAKKALSARLGLKNDDIPLFQVTHILRRKGIETAIELVHRLDDPRLQLIITGNYTDDAGRSYFNELMEAVLDRQLGSRVHFAHELFSEEFSLSDAYATASACTYFSRAEGFGNAFVEAVLAKKPVFVNNYKPVFMPDIGSKGFKTIMIEDGQLNEEALAGIADVLYKPAIARDMVETNYELGKRCFSYTTLREKLEELIMQVQKMAGGNRA